MSDGKPQFDLEDEYNTIAVQLEEQELKCTVHGWAGIVCSPCPHHRDERFDAVYLDATTELTWKCLKGDEVDLPIPDITAETLKNSKGKIKAQHKADFRAELLARKYAILRYVLSTKAENGYAVFVYREDLGKYTLADKEILRGEMQAIFEELFSGERLPDTISRYAYFDVAEMTHRGYDMSIFEHDTGDTYILPFRDKDVLINRVTGETKVLDKDPLGRPVNMALPYNFSIMNGIDAGMPAELEELLTLVPSTHQMEFLFELASPLVMSGTRRIYINFSRVGATGKTTVLNKLRELYGDLVAWANVNTLGERFENSLFLGRSAVLLDEYEGAGLRARREFKELASGNELRIEVKNGPILNQKNKLTVIMNTNVLRFKGADDALLNRFIIIPFIRNFPVDNPVPSWSPETRARIIAWLVRNILPQYFKRDIKKYSIYKLKDWAEKAERDEPPEDGLDEFLRYYFYKHEEKPGVLISLEQAFKYYLLWADQVGYIPVSYQEFVDKLEMISLRDREWIIEKDNGKKLCMKKSGLAFFI